MKRKENALPKACGDTKLRDACIMLTLAGDKWLGERGQCHGSGQFGDRSALMGSV